MAIFLAFHERPQKNSQQSSFRFEIKLWFVVFNLFLNYKQTLIWFTFILIQIWRYSWINESVTESQSMLEKSGFLFHLIATLSITHYTYGGSIEDKYFCKRNYKKGGNRARIIGGHEARPGKILFPELCQNKKCLRFGGMHHFF